MGSSLQSVCSDSYQFFSFSCSSISFQKNIPHCSMRRETLPLHSHNMQVSSSVPLMDDCSHIEESELHKSNLTKYILTMLSLLLLFYLIMVTATVVVAADTELFMEMQGNFFTQKKNRKHTLFYTKKKAPASRQSNNHHYHLGTAKFPLFPWGSLHKLINRLTDE